MAKTCNICKMTYADELASCPHCAESIEFAAEVGDESSPVVRLRETGASIDESMTMSDSDIDLAESLSALGEDKPQDPTSGASSVAWASLVEEDARKPAQPESGELKVDSPSDKDILQQAAKKKPAPPPAAPAPPPEPPPPPGNRPSDAEIVVFDDENLAGSSTSMSAVEASDSGTILADPASSSGVSMVRWDSLVEGETGAAEPRSGVRVDAPSDQDILKSPGGPAKAEKPPVGRPSDSQVEIGESGPPSDVSMIRWDALVEADSPSGVSASSGVKIDSPSDASLLERIEEAEEAEMAAPPEAAEAAEVAESDSGELGLPKSTGEIDLGGEVFAAGNSDVNLDSDREKSQSGGSGIGLAGRPGGAADLPLEAIDEAVAEADVPALEGMSSATDLGAATPSTERPSGRDLIAESVESGVDLDQLTVEMGSSRSALDDSGPLPEAPSDPSSAVDLGATIAPEMGSSGNAAGVSSGAVAAQLLDDGSSGTLSPPVRRGTDVDLEEPSSAVDIGETSELATADSSSSMRQRGGAAVEEISELAEEEPAAVQEEEEELVGAGVPERPTPKPPKPKYGRRWAGGGLLGMVVGAGACIGLWAAGFDLPAEWRFNKPEPKGPPPAAQPVQTLQTSIRDLKGGDIDQALRGLQGTGDEPDRLAARGEARWLQYVRDQKKDGKPLKADDDPVKQAIEDLKKADSADALFWLGHIQEQTGNPAEARKTYEAALKRFEADPAQKRRFQAALDRLESFAQAGPVAQLEALALVLITLQPPPAGEPAADDEAGFYFWDAVKLAQKGDYAKAIEALDRARATHDKQRFARLRKAQNPLSDPTEEVFLKTCEELKTYWLVRAQLKEKGYLDDKQRDVVKALAEVPTTAQVADFKKDAGKLKDERDLAEKKAMEAEKTAKDLTDKLADAKKSVDDLTRKVDMEQKENTKLTDALKIADGKVKAVTARLDAAGIKPDDLARGVDELAVARKTAEDGLDLLARKLKDAKLQVPDRRPETLGKALDRALDIFTTSEPARRLKDSLERLDVQEKQLGQRRTPQELLDIWMSLLQAAGSKELAAKAAVDVERVNRDAGSNAEAKAKAQYVQGLALRSEGKIAEARSALEQAVKGVEKPAEDDWRFQAQKLLQQVSDPTAYYLPQAEELYQRNRDREALNLLDEALAIFPKDNGRLLALRSLVRLELARAKGKLAAADPAVQAAGQDAQDAIKAGAVADGHYAEGRLAEELGNLADARRNYQQALAAGGESAGANRYRLALARVLLKLEQGRTAVPGGGRIGRLPATEAELAETLVALIVLAAQVGAAPSPNLEEAQKLADEVLASRDDPTSFLYKSQAMALKGLWSKALLMYVEGLRPHLKRDQAETLLELVKNHPALRRPDSLTVANPLAAEQHYASGLRYYNARDYAAAEKELLAAVENDNQDARYHYFLGLSRLPLNKRDEAFEDFEQGARLELQNRPSRQAVSTALERVQGPQRQAVNRFRP